MDKYEIKFAILNVSNWDYTKKDYYLNMNVYEFYELVYLKKYERYLEQESNTRKAPDSTG